jgi:type I restriction enzyme, S subunit
MSQVNENRPGYKETKVGWIPEEWESTKIESVAIINPNNRLDLKNTDKITFLSMSDVTNDGKIVNENIRLFSEVKNGYTYFEIGDILIAKITPCFENGKGAYIKTLPTQAGFGSTEFHVLRSKEIEPLYLFYQVRQTHFMKYAQSNMTGTAGQKRVPTGFIKTYKIPLPPLPEQKKIAEILSTWDEAIEKLEKLIELKERRKKGLMQQLLTGKKRLPGYGQPIKKDGEIPEGWEKCKLESIGSFSKGIGLTKSQLSETGTPCILYGQLYTKYQQHISKFYTYVDLQKQISFKSLSFGDILFAGSGETAEEIGTSASFISSESAVAGGDIIILSNHKQNPYFLGYLLDSNEINHQKYKLAQGHSVVHIYSRDIAKIEIWLPPLDEQDRIAQVLTDSQQAINCLIWMKKDIQNQKKGLMQKLLTGEVRVKN